MGVQGLETYDAVSRWFRDRRKKRLLDGLSRLHDILGRDLEVIDVGGVEGFWEVTGCPPFANITILNLPEAFEKPYWFNNRMPKIRKKVGSALDLSMWRNGRTDLVISNSVIEHVGDWAKIEIAARELRGVAPNGWVQTPAFSFPIEPHFALPFIHRFAAPIRAKILPIVPHHGAGASCDVGRARHAVEENNLLSAAEFRFLFRDAMIHRERFLGLTKSLIATWGAMTPDPTGN